MSPEEIRQFDDPLMGRLQKKEDKNSKHAATTGGKGGNRKALVVLGILGLLAVLSIVSYFLYEAQQNIEALSSSLTQGQQQLNSVSQQLQTSQSQLTELQQDLTRNEQKLGSQSQEISRYKTLYRDLKTQQSEQGQELETIAIRKADQETVDALSDRAAGLEGEVGQINTRVGQINNNISDLRDQTTRNRVDLDQTRTSLDEVRLNTESNGQEIAAVKNSLERDYYSFELQKNGSVIKVFDVSLSLKDTDFSKQRFHVEILANGQRIRKKGQHVNEPILFYVDGKEKPYELVVNKVDRKFVTGHLSVPKS